MAYLFKDNFFFERTDKWTDERTNKGTNGRMDGRMDGQSDFIMPQILFGGIKRHMIWQVSTWHSSLNQQNMGLKIRLTWITSLNIKFENKEKQNKQKLILTEGRLFKTKIMCTAVVGLQTFCDPDHFAKVISPPNKKTLSYSHPWIFSIECRLNLYSVQRCLLNQN